MTILTRSVPRTNKEQLIIGLIKSLTEWNDNQLSLNLNKQK